MRVLALDHPLFKAIRADHQQVSAVLDSLALTESTALKEKVDWLWNFNELTHHYKEETLLFSVVAAHPTINEGGPLCTLYFGNHLMDPPLQRCQKITQQTPTIEEHQKIYFRQKSPIIIPISEHRAGKEVLHFIRSSWNQLEPEKIRQLLATYQEIQTQHFNKEESCFFHICLRALNLPALDQIFESWQRAK